MTKGIHSGASPDKRDRNVQKFWQMISITNHNHIRLLPDLTVQTLSILTQSLFVPVGPCPSHKMKFKML